MASVTSSSRRSSSSYRSSSRYSSSSSYRSEGSLGGASDCLDPLFEPFLDSADRSSLFGEEGPGGPSGLAPYSRQNRSSCGHAGEGVDVTSQKHLQEARFRLISSVCVCVCVCVCE
ncbi:putative heat shock protein beta-7-like [Scophthalmus maximus]|uniref:Putative heat shock protein beta-7-like n=1 Tax=Scophthalmus maximus TaxID=52904 RepID=A0A2U9B3K1_SCOMX|nr:putative heat shock protein beta-7-like [Scophthalmus maximus]